MPSIPSQTKCSELGCNNPRSKLSSCCLEHGGFDVYKPRFKSRARKEFNAHYSTPFWRSFRIRQLTQQPLCQSCLSKGIVSSAAHVDHLFPWAQIGEEAFMHNVFQSLCHECHLHKTALEGKGICRYFNAQGAVDYSLGDYAYALSESAKGCFPATPKRLET